MRPGDLVTTRPIPHNEGKCYRVFDLLQREQQVDPENYRFARVVDKLWHGEIATVLQVTDDVGEEKAQVLTPRGLTGWLKTDLLQVVQSTRGNGRLGT